MSKRKRSIFTHLLSDLESTKPRTLLKGVALLAILILFVWNLSCEKGLDPRSKTNSPPAITAVSILPEKPDQKSELNVLIQSKDPDGDAVTYSFQWIKNDEDMVVENKNMLKGGIFKKGDVIQVKVIPSDGKEKGKPFLSDPVKILNSPPVVQEVWVEPRTPSARDNLVAHEKSLDADGDPVYFTYQWEKNGVALMDERREVLEQGRFKKGDSITVTIIPDDREILGAPQKSALVTILNSSPTIVSSPPFSAEGTKYQYHVKAVDPDNDPVTFAVKSGPKGMKMDQNTGFIQWELQKVDQGSHTIEIEVSDSEGAKSYQRFTLVIEFR